MKEWAHGVRILSIIVKRHPQSAYASLEILIQVEWQYLQRTVPGVGTQMGPIEEGLRDTFLPVLFRGKEVNADFFIILAHSVRCGSLGIPDPYHQRRVCTTPPM